MIYDLLKELDKEVLYDSYIRMVDKPKDYKKINNETMIKECLSCYTDYNSLLSICTYGEVRLLYKIVKHELDIEQILSDRNHTSLIQKFLMVMDPKDNKIIIPENIEKLVLEAYDKMDKEREEQKETLNIILIGLLRIYGMLKEDDLYEILKNYIVLDKEAFITHINNNKYFKFYINKVNYKRKEYYIFRTYNMFIDTLYEGIKSFDKVDYFLRPFDEIIYLKFNNFYDLNRDINEFLKKMESYDKDYSKLYNEITICTVLDDDREAIKKYIRENIKEKKMDNLLELLDNAMDNMPSACLKGYTRKEYLEKLSQDKFEAKYDEIKYDPKVVEYREIREKTDVIRSEAMYYAFQNNMHNKFNDLIKKNNIFFYEDDTNVVENIVLYHSIDDEESNFDLFYKNKVTIFYPYYDLFKEYKDSYVEGVFQIVSVHPKEGFIVLKSDFSKREYKVYDIALSMNTSIKNYYVYTSLVTVENYTFTTNYAFVVEKYDKNKIKKYKGIKNKNTCEFLSFYELYRDSNLDIVNREID